MSVRDTREFGCSSHLLADPLQAHHVVRQNFVGEVLRALKLVPFRLVQYLECMRVQTARWASPSQQTLLNSRGACKVGRDSYLGYDAATPSILRVSLFRTAGCFVQ